MPNQHKTRMLGWHPPAELRAWVVAEADRRGVDMSVILTEALAEYHARRDPWTPRDSRPTERDASERDL